MHPDCGAESAGKGEEMNDLLTLICPSCGGLLQTSEGNTNTVCSHCDTPLLLQGVTRRYLIESAADATGVIRAVGKKLDEVSRGVFKYCRVGRPFLAYVPFWLVSCRVDGYVFGVKPVYKERKIRIPVENDRGGTQGTIVRVIKQRKGIRAEEHQISNEISMIISAANLEPLGIPSLGKNSQMGLKGMALGRSGTGLPLKVFDSEHLPGNAHVVDPSVSIAQARRESEEYVSRLCEGVGVGLEQRSTYLSVTGSKERLIHYPLWTVDYSFEKRHFRIVVDGVNCEVLRGTFPADYEHWKKVSGVLGSVWAGLLPLILLVIFSGILKMGPVLMFFILSLWGLGAVSLRFLNMAGKSAGMDNHI